MLEGLERKIKELLSGSKSFYSPEDAVVYLKEGLRGLECAEVRIVGGSGDWRVEFEAAECDDFYLKNSYEEFYARGKAKNIIKLLENHELIRVFRVK